jgi:hypothetical protein
MHVFFSFLCLESGGVDRSTIDRHAFPLNKLSNANTNKITDKNEQIPKRFDNEDLMFENHNLLSGNAREEPCSVNNKTCNNTHREE